MAKRELSGNKVIFILVFTFALVSFVSAALHNYPNFAQASFTINNNVLSISDDIIYNTGYYSVNGAAWTQFPLQGTPYGGGQPWILEDGTSSLNLPSTGTHYVIIFSCSLVNNAWDCHDNMWQLRVIEGGASFIELPSSNMARFAQCLTDQGAIMYGLAHCSSCRAQREMFGEDWQYINYIDCEDIRPECEAVGITGYPTWVINGQEYGGSSLARLSRISGCEAP